ncbi:MAG: hypothetical protein B9S32_07270 [Verrucomicrobia bacterium Tous-C9LFEB]|nr:MAG: hypothetical protein B9S32_07270 [Verrucomicrobia bacterium Tous-C9LFEB]
MATVKVKKKYYDFGRKLSLLRSLHKATQEQIAEKADISLQYYQSLEQGEKMAAYPTLVKLKKALQAKSWDEILP